MAMYFNPGGGKLPYKIDYLEQFSDEDDADESLGEKNDTFRSEGNDIDLKRIYIHTGGSSGGTSSLSGSKSDSKALYTPVIRKTSPLDRSPNPETQLAMFDFDRMNVAPRNSSFFSTSTQRYATVDGRPVLTYSEEYTDASPKGDKSNGQTQSTRPAKVALVRQVRPVTPPAPAGEGQPIHPPHPPHPPHPDHPDINN